MVRRGRLVLAVARARGVFPTPAAYHGRMSASRVRPRTRYDSPSQANQCSRVLVCEYTDRDLKV